MMKQVLTPLVIAVLLSFSACSRPADFGTKEQSVAVNCVLSYPSSTQTLTLSYTIPNGKGNAVAIDEAEVSLYDQTTGALAGIFMPMGAGLWQASISVTPGHQYRLDIDVKNEKYISAVTVVPESKEMAFLPNGVVTWTPYIESSTIHKALCSTKYDLSAFDNPVWLYIWNYDPVTNMHVVADRIASSGHVDEFNKSGGAVILDAEWKKRVFEWGGAYHSEYLRFEPRKNSSVFIAGDVSAPFFTALDESSSSLPTVDDPVILYATPAVMPMDQVGFVVLISVSEDYDKYLKDVITRKMKEDSGDIAILYDREQVYTNINGGVGVFGAKLTYYLSWDEPIDAK